MEWTLCGVFFKKYYMNDSDASPVDAATNRPFGTAVCPAVLTRQREVSR